MLRITSQATKKGQLLRLEGKLLSPWVQELESCLVLHSEQAPVQLELSALSFADSAGVKVLRHAMQHGIALSGCTGFLQTLLRSERP
jgi:ABC-type transporter Mla MlaB component